MACNLYGEETGGNENRDGGDLFWSVRRNSPFLLFFNVFITYTVCIMLLFLVFFFFLNGGGRG